MMFRLKNDGNSVHGHEPLMDPMWVIRVMSHSALAHVGSIQCFKVSPRFGISAKGGLVRNW